MAILEFFARDHHWLWTIVGVLVLGSVIEDWIRAARGRRDD